MDCQSSPLRTTGSPVRGQLTESPTQPAPAATHTTLGASKAADALGLPLLTATKTRDFDTGKLTSFEVPQLPRSGRVLVVDDICDGGGTFRGLATAAGIGRDRLALWVSHGIFSGAAGELTGHFAQIFTTDSHPGARRADVGAHVTELAPYLESERN